MDGALGANSDKHTMILGDMAALILRRACVEVKGEIILEEAKTLPEMAFQSFKWVVSS